jgi:hypothetical protein
LHPDEPIGLVAGPLPIEGTAHDDPVIEIDELHTVVAVVEDEDGVGRRGEDAGGLVRGDLAFVAVLAKHHHSSDQAGGHDRSRGDAQSLAPSALTGPGPNGFDGELR